MSLQLIAKQMEAKGRKGDSMLVHMTAKEVAALQKMAESAGGSLSVNPETGLVEANFLKRMLPTLVGIGVGAATMNPYLGAAAGAAVGGYQARRNDQDVLLGAAMGGLGGYGGAGIGAGLGAAGATGTAAQAISNPALAGQQVATGAGSQASMLAAQNAGFGAQGTASLAQAAGAATPSTAAQIGQGISGLGTEAGRGAFMSQVGGGAGLVSDVSMAATPMMAPGKAPGEAPVDDEMYSYEYNPGRTGAERSPMAGTSERKYFNSSYSPMRRIKPSQYGAAQGGLMSLAEGGTTTAPSGTSSEGMTGASKAAFDYLMGRSEDSGFAGQGSGGRGGSGTFSGGDGMYSFDPATGQFTKNPNYRDPEDIERERLAAEAAAEAERRRVAAAEAQAREEARARALPNITPPRQGSIVARPPAVIVGGPIDTRPIRGTPLGEPDGGYPYQPGDVIPNTPDVYSTPYDMSLPQGTPLGDLSPGGGADYSRTDADPVGMDYSGYSAADMGLAQGGLLGLAEGGDIADAGASNGTSGASKAAFDYLMGNAASSAPQGIASLAARFTPVVGADNMYAFDPVTGTFLRNPSVPGSENSGSRVGTSFANIDGGRGDYADPNPGWTDMSDADKAAYYRENPTMAAITQAGQKAAGFTKLGLAQQYAVPDFVANEALIARGIDPMGPRAPTSYTNEGFYSASPGVDSWSGNMSDYAGSSIDQGDRGEAAGGLITLADGGLMGFAKGGMKSGGFVIPADVVSMVGEGNTDAGYKRIKSMVPGATAIKGKDGGQADTVKTHIEGKQPARVAHGEMYIPPETVKRMGGAKKLYAMMDRVRQQAIGSKKQIKPVNLRRAMA